MSITLSTSLITQIILIKYWGIIGIMYVSLLASVTLVLIFQSNNILHKTVLGNEEINKNLPKVSLVIPVYNAEKYIQSCLDRIIVQEYPKDKLEIIIVDNNSTDSTAKIIKSYNVNYVFCEKRGPSAARNKGISISTGEYLIFIDIDCLADKRLIYRHVKAHLFFNYDNRVRVVGGGIGGFNKNLWAICDDFCSWAAYHPSLKPRMSKTHFPTANMSITKSLIDEVGYFNEDKIIGEDVDFCSRAVAKGYNLYFEPEAKVYHINRTSFNSFMGHARSWAKSDSLLEPANTQKYSKYKELLRKLKKYILTYINAILKIVAHSFAANRFHVILFIPFIVLHKTYFAYHKLKFGKEISKNKK